MLHENIKALRKQKGITQEELAIRLHVVRQTISKWEKGLSVPDAEMLMKIADCLDVNSSTLLQTTNTITDQDVDQNEISQQLARINEQLAVKNRRSRRICKVILAIIISVLVFYLLMGILSIISYQRFTNEPSTSIIQNHEE